jgi:hypothetical protein
MMPGPSWLLWSSGRYASNPLHIFYSPRWPSYLYNSPCVFTMGSENRICDNNSRCWSESAQASTTYRRERARGMDNTDSRPCPITKDSKIKCDEREAIISKKGRGSPISFATFCKGKACGEGYHVVYFAHINQVGHAHVILVTWQFYFFFFRMMKVIWVFFSLIFWCKWKTKI